MTNLRTTKPANDQQALRALVSDILARGYSISVNDGEDWPVKRSTDLAEICDAAASVDESLLRLRRPDGSTAGVIDLVFGNAPDELISDHTDTPELDAVFDAFQQCFGEPPVIA